MVSRMAAIGEKFHPFLNAGFANSRGESGQRHEDMLVGGLEHEFYFFHVLRIIIPTDELIFFRGVGIPPTRYVFHVFSLLYVPINNQSVVGFIMIYYIHSCLMLLVFPSRIWNLIEAVRNGVLALKWLGNMFNLLLVSRTSLLHSVRTILFGSNPCNGPSSTWTFHVWNIWVIEFGIPHDFGATQGFCWRIFLYQPWLILLVWRLVTAGSHDRS